MAWSIELAGDRYLLRDRNEQRVLDVKIVRWDRAQIVRKLLDDNDLDELAAQTAALARKRKNEQP